MRFTILFLLLFGCSFGQQNPIKIIIDSISEQNYIKEKIFIVHYVIKNISNHSVTFLFDNSESPIQEIKTNRIGYTIVDENESIVRINFLNNDSYSGIPKLYKELKNVNSKIEIQNILKKKEYREYPIDSNQIYLKFGDKFLSKNEKDSISKIVVEQQLKSLKPNENLIGTIKLHWNKTRYYKIDDLEYYIDEIKPMYIYLALLTSKYDYYQIKNSTIKTEEFFDSVSFSEKVEINFKD